jgi:hypothetical protein
VQETRRGGEGGEGSDTEGGGSRSAEERTSPGASPEPAAAAGQIAARGHGGVGPQVSAGGPGALGDKEATWPAMTWEVDMVALFERPVRRAATEPRHGARRVRYDDEPASFDVAARVPLGRRAERVDPAVFERAEALLAGDEDAEAGVMHEWNPTTSRFEKVETEGYTELQARHEHRKAQVRARAREREDAGARDFLALPSKAKEQRRARIPEATVEMIRNLVEQFNALPLTRIAKEYHRRSGGEALADVARRLGFLSSSDLLKSMRDVVHLSRRGDDVFVHRVVSAEEQKALQRMSVLKRELRAMKARDERERTQLSQVHGRLAREEGRVLSDFRRKLSASDRDLLDRGIAAQRDAARTRKWGASDDPLKREFFERAGAGRASGFGDDASDLEAGQVESQGRKKRRAAAVPVGSAEDDEVSAEEPFGSDGVVDSPHIRSSGLESSQLMSRSSESS